VKDFLWERLQLLTEQFLAGEIDNSMMTISEREMVHLIVIHRYLIEEELKRRKEKRYA
jgi:hypothetical protein